MKKTILTLTTTMLLFTTALAQNAAELDLTFDAESNTSSAIESVTLQPDGKIIVTGHFSQKIVRLNTDGSKDPTFSQPADWGAILKDVALLPDGKIIVAGNFTDFDGVPVNHIVRLNADGTVDNTFDQGSGANNYLNSIAVQADGKIIIGGVFTAYDGTPANGIIRLNADGTVDHSFDPGTGLAGISAEAESIEIQTDGKILIAGKFTSYDGNPSPQSARINADGSFDASYAAPSLSGGSPSERRIADIVSQADGKIIIGGHFERVAGLSRKCIARLNTDGTVDTSFKPGDGAQLTYGTLVASMYVMPGGKILIGGKFNTYDGINRKSIARLNADGSLDMTFDPGTGLVDFLPYPMVNNIEVQADGKILIGGDFDEYNGVTRYNIARLNGDGTAISAEKIKDDFTLHIYPNPAENIVKVRGVPGKSILRLTDLTGEILYEQFVLNNSESLDVSRFADGIYLLQIENNNNVVNRKLIVKK